MNYKTRNKQSGAVLAISLVLLSAITLLAAMNMQRAGLQTRITANILHKEQTSDSALNDQEFLFFQLQNSDTGDPILNDPIRSFTMVNGEREYSPVVLSAMVNGVRVYSPSVLNANNTLLDYMQTNSRLILTDTVENENIIALAEGENSGDQVLYRYELWTTASIAGQTAGRSSTEYQVTGMSFPGLNNTQNSLYAAP